MKKILVFLIVLILPIVAQAEAIELEVDAVYLEVSPRFRSPVVSQQLKSIEHKTTRYTEELSENNSESNSNIAPESFIMTDVEPQEAEENFQEGDPSKNITIKGEVTFEWLNFSQIKRDQVIEEYKAKVFAPEYLAEYKKSEFREKYSDFIKDPNYKEHYRLAKNGVTETANADLCAFHYKDSILLVYAVQYKNNPRIIYYYNGYGTLAYIDEISENYPNFPYVSKQYRANGSLVSGIYFTSKDTQYMYEPNQAFKGIWYKDKMYDRKAKQTLTRTNW